MFQTYKNWGSADRVPNELKAFVAAPVPLTRFVKDMPSRLSTKSEKNASGPALDKADAQARTGLFNLTNVVGFFDCCGICSKPRAIHAIDPTDEELDHLCNYLDYQPAQCGVPLIEHDNALAGTFFASHTPVSFD